jgi:hypothetical protein
MFARQRVPRQLSNDVGPQNPAIMETVRSPCAHISPPWSNTTGDSVVLKSRGRRNDRFKKSCRCQSFMGSVDCSAHSGIAAQSISGRPNRSRDDFSGTTCAQITSANTAAESALIGVWLTLSKPPGPSPLPADGRSLACQDPQQRARKPPLRRHRPVGIVRYASCPLPSAGLVPMVPKPLPPPHVHVVPRRRHRREERDIRKPSQACTASDSRDSPAAVRVRLRAQLERVRGQHEANLAAGRGSVALSIRQPRASWRGSGSSCLYAHHSRRSTRAGSIRDARIAGMTIATSAMATTSSVEKPRISGSEARTSYSWLDTTRPAV